MAMAVIIRTGSQPLEPVERPRMVEVRLSEWETDYCGARMGSLVNTARPAASGDLLGQANALAHELRGALREAELDGYRHLIYRVDAGDLPGIWAAERAGLRLMDVAVDLSYRFGSTPVLLQPNAQSVRHGTPSDIPAMRAMTVGAFNLTRFAVDPFFRREQVDDFYQTWATNLYAGLADVVLVADIDDQPAGFVSCKRGQDGQGRIPLVATASAFQRRGVARGLMSAALAWFAEAGCTVAYVKTQAANYAAVALYERAGFTVAHTELTFTTTLN
jgi:ribosomal protein S18 acetylase RimI-like enzyme